MLRTHLVAFSASVALGAASVSAQCQLAWAPGAAEPGPNGAVYELTRLPGGDLVAAGTFTRADSSLARGVARWDGVEWRALGAGVIGTIGCSLQLANGDLLVGGTLQTAGGSPARGVARWNGTSWSTLGTGLEGPVLALLEMPNGDVLAGGDWFFNQPASIRRVARWNGVSWSQLGTVPFGTVRGLARLANGDVLATGSFNSGGMSGPAIRWDGTNWTFVAALGTTGFITDLVALPNGGVVVAGDLDLPSGSDSIAVFDGTTATGLGAPFAAARAALLANGRIVASTFNNPVEQVGVFDGVQWTTLPSPTGVVQTIVGNAANEPVIGVRQQELSGHSVYRFDGFSWQPVGAPLPPVVNAMATLPNGHVILGGSFSSFRGVAANNVVRWDGVGYAPLGAGVDGPVGAIAIGPGGTVIVGGSFSSVGGVAAAQIARWDGQVWSTVGSGVPSGVGSVVALGAAPDGTIYAARFQGLFRFAAGQWSQIPIAGTPIIRSVSVLPSGVVALGGVFISLPGASTVSGLAQFDNGVVSAFPGTGLGAQINPPMLEDTLVTQNGDLVIAGSLAARWDGTTWTTLPTGVGTRVAELPDGDLLFGGNNSTGPTSAPTALNRLRGTQVTPLPGIVANVRALAVAGTGEVMVAGSIDSVQNQVSAGIAIAAPTCRATAGIVGSGCTGSAGAVTLLADTLPWLGSDYRSTARGMTPSSIALQAFGAPLASTPLPSGAAGCNLFVDPFFALAALPTGGAAALSLRLPNDPALVGTTTRQQVVAVELGAAGIVQLTSSNAVDLTIGAL